MQDNQSIAELQRRFLATGATLPVDYRLEQLKKLKSLLEIHESKITTALKQDLNKAPFETIRDEVILVVKEIDFICKHLKKWMRPVSVKTPIPFWPGRSKIYYEPYGSVFIIGPWNYPLLLVLSPLIGALSAGNCALVKPSELAPNTQNLIENLLNDNFPVDYIHVVKGGPDVVTHLLEQKFDYIFFTGGTQIGKIIMTAAAKHLTPVTLELGGKSPCIVDETADLNYAARRIAWAKTTNAGQVCLAPDYLYVHESCKAELVKKIQETFVAFYGEQPESSDSYARIINKKHFDRLSKLMQKGNILWGGIINEHASYISPTLIDGVSWDDPIMQEEIFGPLLPILTYQKIEEVVQAVQSHQKPLALYLFSKNQATKNKLLQEVSFGGGCINDCLLHIANANLPFGGVGASGLGNYHGKFSFETFSHRKSVYTRTICIDSKVEYPPYSSRKLWWLRQLLKL